MSWDYFGVFAIAALHFWGFGAFAAWHGKRPTAVYVLTLTGLAIGTSSYANDGRNSFMVLFFPSIGRAYYL